MQGQNCQLLILASNVGEYVIIFDSLEPNAVFSDISSDPDFFKIVLDQVLVNDVKVVNTNQTLDRANVFFAIKVDFVLQHLM